MIVLMAWKLRFSLTDMPFGTINFIHAASGLVSIEQDGGGDNVFVPINDVNESDTVEVGQRVQYENGWKKDAINVIVLA